MNIDEFKKHLRNKVVSLYEEFDNTENRKDFLRELHIRAKKCADENSFFKTQKLFDKHRHYFKEPSEININNISPALKNVDDDKVFSELFSIVRRTWSMPFNKGYGRRLRYVIFDEYHSSVIGIIGLQSPPADLACRDELFDYPKDQKLNLVNQTMDIYSLGSVPPYSQILGGKLVAGLAASKRIQEDYQKKYAGKITLLENSNLDSTLVALTTTSAFGRSSIYNRLKFRDKLLAEPIGYTKGYGSVHLEPVYEDLKKVLVEEGKLHNGGYGRGPKQKWQNITRALQSLGLDTKYGKHGVKRQVFLYRLVDDLTHGMSGDSFGDSLALNIKDFSEYWKHRWALPRAERNPEWENLSTHDYFCSHLTNY